MSKIGVNLRVFTIDEEGKAVYYPMHLGFFPKSIIPAIVENLNARGIAFHSDIARQTGEVHIVTYRLAGDNPADETTVKILGYEPPRVRD